MYFFLNYVICVAYNIQKYSCFPVLDELGVIELDKLFMLRSSLYFYWFFLCTYLTNKWIVLIQKQRESWEKSSFFFSSHTIKDFSLVN